MTTEASHSANAPIPGLSLIACVSSDLGLGQGNDLLWRFKADQQFFRRTTLGHPVAMGSRTYASIGRPLPGRENLVLTRHPLAVPGLKTFSSADDLTAYLRQLTLRANSAQASLTARRIALLNISAALRPNPGNIYECSPCPLSSPPLPLRLPP